MGRGGKEPPDSDGSDLAIAVEGDPVAQVVCDHGATGGVSLFDCLDLECPASVGRSLPMRFSGWLAVPR
jgi:hypothetical protein